MKTRMKLLLSLGLALPLIGVGPIIVSAQGIDELRLQSILAASEENAANTNETEENEQPEAEDKQKADKRIKERKDKQKIKLAAAEQQRLKTRCKASQGKISSQKGRTGGIETSHGKVYTGLVDRLTTLSDKLKTQGVDAAQLNTQIAELKTKIEKFNTNLATYKDATSDLSSMDCAADPEGFKASLEAARTQLAALRQDATSIKAYVKDTIKPTLQAIRKQLDPKAVEETTEPTATTGGGAQ